MGDKQLQIALPGTGPLLCFGGPYSNLEATCAMRAEATRLGIAADRVICTGDIVAYCANPYETATEIRDWGCHVIKGNCEEQLARRANDCGCGFDDGSSCDLLSRAWYGYADAIITDDLRSWMQGLPETLVFELAGRTIRIIHGGVSQTNRFIFPSTPAVEKSAELGAANADVVIAGHSGIPFIEPIGQRIWFNPGVIGIPANDGTPDGWFGLITPEANARLCFALKRLPYDASGAATALNASGYAPPYAEALISGRWPAGDVLPSEEATATGHPLRETDYLMI